jgi:hypothetical protein
MNDPRPSDNSELRRSVDKVCTMVEPRPGDPDVDRLQGSVRSLLRDLDEDLERIIAGAELTEPDSLIARLADSASDLDRAVNRLCGALRWARDDIDLDLSRMAAAALERVLTDHEQPLVVRCSWGSGLPRVEATSGVLSAALHRVLAIAIRHAGRGGEVSIGTGQHDGRPLLQIDVDCNDPVSLTGQQEPLHLRCRSVEDFVRAMGGSFHVANGPDGGLHALLLFNAGIATT